MIVYNEMQKSNNGIPQWQSFLEPVLSFLKDSGLISTKKLKQSIVIKTLIPKKFQNLKYDDSQYETIIENRIGFAVSELKNSGLLDSEKRGSIEINVDGLRYLKEHGKNIDYHDLEKLPKYQEHKKLVIERKKSKNKPEINTDVINDNVPVEEIIRKIVDDSSDDIANKLLENILNLDPHFFEQLTLDLLIKMGYKGPNGLALVTQLTKDDGIDGVINQDPLGTKTIYIQAKRYSAKTTVDRTEIQKFYGALAEKGNEKGVFITTSSFSEGAKNLAKNYGNIITINGIQLTNLMIEYKVGVNIKETFELLSIDEDYFTE